MFTKPLPELVDSDIERFWSKVRKTEDCWLWTDFLNPKGYGAFAVNGIEYRAHRISYKLSGRRLDTSHVVRHRCDNPACVRPKHLVRGTMRDNRRDMFQRGRDNIPRGAHNKQTKLSALKVLAARALLLSGSSPTHVANLFGVHRMTISDIETGKTWAWLDDNGINTRTGESVL